MQHVELVTPNARPGYGSLRENIVRRLRIGLGARRLGARAPRSSLTSRARVVIYSLA